MDAREDEMRAGLRRLAEGTESEVDVAAVIEGGDRLRRRRWGGWAAVGVAAVMVAALVVWPALVGRPVTAIPDPASSPAPVQPVASGVVLGFTEWDPHLVYDEVRIDVLWTGETLAVDVAAGAPNGPPEVTGSYETPAGRYWSTRVTEDLMVAVIPERVASVTTVGVVEEPVDSAPLPGLEMTAVAVQRTDTQGEVTGLTWQALDGVVRSSVGEVVSAELVYPGGRLVVYRDEALQVWGYIDHVNGDRQTKPLDTEPVGTMVGLSATSQGEYYLNSMAIGFLPPGGTEPAFTFPHEGISWTSAVLGDTGQIVFLVKADRIKHGRAMVDSIAYTDSSGERVTYDPYPSRERVTPRPHVEATCQPMNADLLAAANRAGKVGRQARFVTGHMVQATPQWWLVAVEAEISDPDYATANGLDDNNLMAFATNAPSGGSDWVPLGRQADWDGTTPTGENLPLWREYRLIALGCAGPG